MTPEDTIARDEVARQNAETLAGLMAKHGLLIPARDFPLWRPTLRATGDIAGIRGELTVIATNGILAYFLTATDETFVGHIQKFSGKVKPLFSLPKPQRARKKSASASAKRKAMLETL